MISKLKSRREKLEDLAELEAVVKRAKDGALLVTSKEGGEIYKFICPICKKEYDDSGDDVIQVDYEWFCRDCYYYVNILVEEKIKDMRRDIVNLNRYIGELWNRE